jgi:hypothetical protein
VHTYDDLLLRIRAVVDILDARRTTLDHVVHVDAATADEETNECAEYRINAMAWLGIERADDAQADLCLYLDYRGWQIDINLEDDDVQIPDQPTFMVDADPTIVADYVERTLLAAEPALRA